jgi:hypothetical protein
LENNNQHTNHWLGINLQSPHDGTVAIGTRISITTGNGKQIRVYQPSTGYLSSSDPRIHFGTGRHEVVDEIEIIWPDGDREILKNVRCDQYLSVAKGKGIVSQ